MAKLNITLIQNKLTKRLGRKATQNDIADILGVSQVTIHNLIKNENSKALEILERASEVLKIPMEKLVIK